MLADTSLSLRFTTNSDQGMKPSVILVTPSNVLYTYKIVFGDVLLCTSGPVLTLTHVASLSLNCAQSEIICSTVWFVFPNTRSISQCHSPVSRPWPVTPSRLELPQGIKCKAFRVTLSQLRVKQKCAQWNARVAEHCGPSASLLLLLPFPFFIYCCRLLLNSTLPPAIISGLHIDSRAKK